MQKFFVLAVVCSIVFNLVAAQSDEAADGMLTQDSFDKRSPNAKWMRFGKRSPNAKWMRFGKRTPQGKWMRFGKRSGSVAALPEQQLFDVIDY